MKLETATERDAFEDLKSHRTAWRNSLVQARVAAQNTQFNSELTPEELATVDANVTYWNHEIAAFDRAFDILIGKTTVVDSEIDLSKQHHPMELPVTDTDEAAIKYDPDHIVVPKKFDIEAEERAWKIWTERGHGHESFVRCIEAYIEDASNSIIKSLLCEDEGCPQHGTPHVCVNTEELYPSAATTEPVAPQIDNSAQFGGLPRYQMDAPGEYPQLHTYRLLGPAIYTDTHVTNYNPSESSVKLLVNSAPVNVFKNEVTGEIVIEDAMSRRFRSIPNELKDESAGDMLSRLGMDGMLWAEEFNDIAVRIGYMKMDEGWLTGWFANAIRAGFDTAKNRYDPQTIEMRRKFGLTPA